MFFLWLNLQLISTFMGLLSNNKNFSQRIKVALSRFIEVEFISPIVWRASSLQHVILGLDFHFSRSRNPRLSLFFLSLSQPSP